MERDDVRYYRSRAIQEQVAAQNATCEAARHRHDELAVMYRFRAGMLTIYPSAGAEYPTEADAATEPV